MKKYTQASVVGSISHWLNGSEPELRYASKQPIDKNSASPAPAETRRVSAQHSPNSNAKCSSCRKTPLQYKSGANETSLATQSKPGGLGTPVELMIPVVKSSTP